MNIKIQIIDEKPQKKWGVLVVKGEIQINDFRETLYSSLDWWRLDDYTLQWQEGLERLVDHDSSCLVVMIDDPRYRRFVEWWVLYKVGNKVYVRNSIMIADIYEERIGDKPFTVKTCYNFIPDRGGPCDEEGNKISEWVVDWSQ